MGRKTWESLPKRPLPGRINIVVSRTMAADAGTGAASSPLVFSSLRDALAHCAQTQKVFICGGASVYQEALAFATSIELTLIHKPYAGDVFFPDIDPAQWVITATADFDGYSFISYGKLGDIETNNA
jgi:dihydrofolate reductase